MQLKIAKTKLEKCQRKSKPKIKQQQNILAVCDLSTQ